MTKPEISEALKEIKDVAFLLRMQKRVLTLQEFEKHSTKLYNLIDRLKKQVDGSNEQQTNNQKD